MLTIAPVVDDDEDDDEDELAWFSCLSMAMMGLETESVSERDEGALVSTIHKAVEAASSKFSVRS